MKLTSDTILITGGASGIGFEMAKQLVTLGNKVIITGRSLSKLEQAKSKLPGVETYRCDVNDLHSVKDMYEKVTSDFPALNVIINNTGLMRSIDFNDASAENICDEIETNLCGPMRMVQVFLPHLKDREEAAVVNVTSGLAFITFPKAPVYCASKIGLHTYTKSLRKHLANTNVKAFELAPSKTSRPMFNRDTTGKQESGNRMPIMDVPKVVEAMIKGIRKDKFEILPGMSKVLKIFGRFTL